MKSDTVYTEWSIWPVRPPAKTEMLCCRDHGGSWTECYTTFDSSNF